ncbi:hypothetical protein NDU88_002358, partial [Pleurodeles waltl]
SLKRRVNFPTKKKQCLLEVLDKFLEVERLHLLNPQPKTVLISICIKFQLR